MVDGSIWSIVRMNMMGFDFRYWLRRYHKGTMDRYPDAYYRQVSDFPYFLMVARSTPLTLISSWKEYSLIGIRIFSICLTTSRLNSNHNPRQITQSSIWNELWLSKLRNSKSPQRNWSRNIIILLAAYLLIFLWNAVSRMIILTRSKPEGHILRAQSLDYYQ